MASVMAIFWNSEQRRLRAAWRVSAHFVLWIALPAILHITLELPLAFAATNLFPPLAGVTNRIALYLMTLVGIVLGTWIAARWLDRRPFAELGLHINRRWWLHLGGGAMLGALLITLVFLTAWAAGWVRVVGFWQVREPGSSFVLALAAPLVAFAVISITEELLSRGYQCVNLAEGFCGLLGERGAVMAAWLISSALFGLLHAFNPHSSWVSTFNLMLIGLLFGLGFVLTGSLALPIGLHFTWNFFQANVFGFPVSGRDFSAATVIAVEEQGPALWTGGAFGPEAGLVGVAAVVVGCALVAAWVWAVEGRRPTLRREIARYEPLGARRTRD